MIISTAEEYDKLKNRDRYTFLCKVCYIDVSVQKRIERRSKQIRFLCSKCGKDNTCLEKYGTTNPLGLDSIATKRKSTCLAKYGKPFVSQVDEFKEKAKQTCQELYGTDNPMQNEQIYQKQQNTLKENYGVSNPSYSEEIKERKRQTCNEHFGVDVPFQSPIVQNKIALTLKERLGVEHPAQSPIVLEKMRNTLLERTGYVNNLQTSQVKEARTQALLEKFGSISPFQNEVFRAEHRKGKNIIKYDGLIFDSSWELAFYLFHRDNGIDIKREPIALTYTYNHIEYKYYPDFQVGEQLYEIKADYFFDSNGNLIDPFRPKRNGKALAKHLCALEHNVLYIKSKEIKPYLKYMSTSYGLNFWV